jgi:hypothetical protein
MFRNVAAHFQQPPITLEVLDNIAAILEAVHDIGEIGGVFQSERMPAFMQTGEVDDGIAQQGVGSSGPIDIGSQGAGVRQDIDNRAALSVDHNGLRLAVKVHGAVGPVDADAGVSFGRTFPEDKRATRFALPGREGPGGELFIAGSAAGEPGRLLRAGIHLEAVFFRRTESAAKGRDQEPARGHVEIVARTNYNDRVCSGKF